RTHRIAEVLEGRAAHCEIERVVREGQRRGVALLEFDIDAGGRGVFARHANERVADVEAGDPKAEPREVDREIARAGGDLEDVCAGRQAARDSLGGGLEVVGRLGGVLGVPGRQHSLHRNAAVWLLRVCGWHRFTPGLYFTI